MPAEPDVKALLQEAKMYENEFRWLNAADSYQKMIDLTPNEVEKAEILQNLGFCYSSASRQAEDNVMFKELGQRAVDAYEKAAYSFKQQTYISKGQSAHCNAIANYIASFLSVNSSEKTEKLDESLRYGRTSISAYQSADDKLNYGRICNHTMLVLLEKLSIASSWREKKMVVQEGIGCASNAIDKLSKLESKPDLLEAYSLASILSFHAANIIEDANSRKDLSQRSQLYSEKASELTNEIDNHYLDAMSKWAAAYCTLLFSGDVESSQKNAEEMLKQGIAINDNYIQGVAYYILSWATNWMMLREADPDKKREGYEKIIDHSEKAISHLSIVSQDYYIGEVLRFRAEGYSSLALEVEASLEEKRALLKKAVEFGRKGLEYAIRSGSPDVQGSTLHALSKALHNFSNLQPGEDEKKNLLEEALTHRGEYNKIVESAFSSNDWVRGVGKNYEGSIKADLAKLETEEKKQDILESAFTDMRDGVARCRKWILSRPEPTLISAVARYEDRYGQILNQLHIVTGDQNVLRKAIEAFGNAAKRFKEVNLPSRAAESYWRVGQLQDRLGKGEKAAQSYQEAHLLYEEAAQSIPQFADFYQDYATYMRAWSEIEKAQSAHKQEDFSTAVKHYQQTANLLASTELWNYLSTNFLAWSLLENGEDMSRGERGTEAVEAFTSAVELFAQAKTAIDAEISNIQNIDERGQAIELSEASLRRKDYCRGRVDLEEAKIQDRKGEHKRSAEKYDSAASIFETILSNTQGAINSKEIESTATMCRAWQKKKLADERSSPELYEEASQLFERAKESSLKGGTSLLASGNSAYCQALHHGARFESSREVSDFTAAKRFLASAANYYLKAGFDSASQWTNATEILFDAYNYMINADIEADPEKKMKTYLLAEKCLERSASLYETAGYVGKYDEVLRIQNKVREKSEFALSLGEVMATPNVTSSTSAISTPSMTVEEPVGLLKFEKAFIEANIISNKNLVTIGEDFILEIQLANLGKGIAFLTRVDEVIPTEFEVVKRPEKCMVSSGSLTFSPRKLTPLETREIKLTLKPKRKGEYLFAPRIQYLDETGSEKSCQLEQMTVRVKELGIRGWLRGPG